jgi:transcriptional regulator with XRE-family HTH domain
MESFQEYITRLRSEGELSYRDAAAKAEISAAYLLQIEKGKRDIPSPHILKKLALVYGVPVKEMMRMAGYLDDPSERKTALSEQEEIDLAFNFVLNDPRYKWGARCKGPITLDVKRFVVEMYEQATGKKLLPGE